MTAWFEEKINPIDQGKLEQARAYQLSLTKPPGSLGQLETIAEKFCAWQSTLRPQLNTIQVAVFAGDHGVCAQGVSAFPQAVTGQMISNFLDGGAAISVLSRELGAEFSVINMGTVHPLAESYSQHSQLINANIAAGTADISLADAMTEIEVEQALNTGRNIVKEKEADLFIGGEMGIGNTTSAAAIFAALLSLRPEQVVGAGTGVDAEGLARKQKVIQLALSHHQDILDNPYQILRCLGGLEIAGLVGAYITAAQQQLPVLVDGFICTAAALLAVKLNPRVRDWLLFSHESAEAGHKVALQSLAAEPLLQLGLRLGEGSGAALAVPLLKSALALHNGMASFVQAGVSEKSE